MSFPRFVLAALLPAAFVSAQGPCGPTLRTAPRVSTAFPPAALGVTRIAHIGMIPDPSGVPRRFIGELTVTGLSAALGGVGGYDVVGFHHDQPTNTVTINSACARCNSATDEFALNLAPDASYAVFERLDIGLFQCAVAWDGSLAAPASITGGPLPGSLDPCPARIDGKPVLFFINGSAVGWQAHDVRNAQLTGAITTVATPRVAGGICHSPVPVSGFDRDAEALLVCEQVAGSVSHWRWAGDLDPRARVPGGGRRPGPHRLPHQRRAGGRGRVGWLRATRGRSVSRGASQASWSATRTAGTVLPLVRRSAQRDRAADTSATKTSGAHGDQSLREAGRRGKVGHAGPRTKRRLRARCRSRPSIVPPPAAKSEHRSLPANCEKPVRRLQPRRIHRLTPLRGQWSSNQCKPADPSDPSSSFSRSQPGPFPGNRCPPRHRRVERPS